MKTAELDSIIEGLVAQIESSDRLRRERPLDYAYLTGRISAFNQVIFDLKGLRDRYRADEAAASMPSC